jgi:hypothetical protein
LSGEDFNFSISTVSAAEIEDIIVVDAVPHVTYIVI